MEKPAEEETRFESPAVGVPLSFEVTALDAAAGIRFEETRLDMPGESAPLPVTEEEPFHTHGELQLALPAGTMATDPYSLSFKVTTTSPSFSESAEHTLLLLPGTGDDAGQDDHGDHQ